VEEFTRSRRAVRTEDADESLLDVLTKEKRILNLRSVEAGGKWEKDPSVDLSESIGQGS